MEKAGFSISLRAHATYIPSFHTNLISTNLTEERIDVCHHQNDILLVNSSPGPCT